jgi:hypothetical protein
MFLGTKKKPRERYYLLPGMGRRAYRKKLFLMLGWGILGGVGTSLFVAVALYLMNRFAGP